jgi:hypothetical protein
LLPLVRAGVQFVDGVQVAESAKPAKESAA